MSNTILNACDFDLSVLGYRAKKTDDRGGANVAVQNKMTQSALRLQTPMMLTWGASEYEDKVTGVKDGRFSMSLQFPEAEYATPECSSFMSNMIELENKVKSDALAKSKDWFGKDIKSSEVIDALFSPMVKYPNIKGTKEPDYSRMPTLSLKIPQWQNVFKCELYDEEGNILFPKSDSAVTPIDYLKRTKVMCIIQCGGVWFINGKFGVTWKLLQAVVQKPPDTIQGKCMIVVNSDDKAKFAAQPAASSNEDGDDEGEERMGVVEDSSDEEDAAAPEPAAAVVAPEPVVEAEPAAAVVEEVVEPEVVVPAKKVVRRVVKKSA